MNRLIELIRSAIPQQRRCEGHTIGWLLVAMVAPAIWGSTYVVTTEMLPADKPLMAAVFRALPAGLLLLLFTRALPQGRWWLRTLTLGILNIGGFFYCLFVAAYLLPGGVAALVMSSQPILVMILGVLFLKESLTLHQFIACLTGMAGLSILVLEPSMVLPIEGLLAGLGGAASMATGLVLTKKWGKPEGVSVAAFTGWQLTVGGLFLLPFGLIQEGLPAALTVNNLLGYGYLSLVGALLAYLIWFKAIEKLPVVSVSFVSFASPLSAALLGYFILDETLTPSQLLGAGAIVVAIVISQRHTFTHSKAGCSHAKVHSQLSTKPS
ncbi:MULTISPECIES: EamA family transporter [unclassified Pseudoalteromonas]|uniref:EamA family transporter n=1 Tax=unclassified Pseudoalteromonas TaxID=194690 RepID=UPI0020971ED1|nr:EamA family transporter [Pseudoalteromonas sp. XMcav2-N]MCO7190204.1 EamA family transporter [Pseudoalteromonas sp. XMcav2-N]